MSTGEHGTRKWLMIGLALTIAWAAYLAAFGPRPGGDGLQPPDLTGPALAQPAEFDWPLRDLDDRPVDLAGFRGRPILLNIWATWCGPCLREMPAIDRLAADPRIKAKGVAVVCVSVDRDAATVRRFAGEKARGMTILRATSVPPVFQTEGIPATFLIAPDGRVVASQVGAARWDDPSVVGFLEQMATAGK